MHVYRINLILKWWEEMPSYLQPWCDVGLPSINLLIHFVPNLLIMSPKRYVVPLQALIERIYLAEQVASGRISVGLIQSFLLAS